jgi:signal transduction histidine kinase
MQEETIRILLVEDNPGDVRLIEEMLVESGPDRFELLSSDHLDGALENLEDADLLLLDLGLPDSQGLDGLTSVTTRFPNLPVVVLTGLQDEEVGFAAVRQGAQDFLTKAEVTPDVLVRSITYAIERQRLKSNLEKTSRELRHSEQRFRQLIEQNSDGMLILTRKGKIRFANPAAEKMLGQTTADLLGQEFGFPVGDTETSEMEIVRSDGTAQTCEMRVVETLWQGEGVFFASLRDISERKKMEGHLRYAQKMEAVANLTRGIAHDFNNTLAAIVGYASVLEMKLGDDPELLASLHKILAASDRATRLTRALLVFSRKQPPQMRHLELRGVLDRISQLLPAVLGKGVDFDCRLSEDPLPVLADSGQIEQILVNLAANARQVLPEGGQVALFLEPAELDGGFRERHGFGRPGRYARIVFRDDGPGMDEESTQKIFEPFFTTGDSSGSGLGLAIVYGIVKQHRGYILCSSRPREGSRFDIYLPLDDTFETRNPANA